MNKKIDIFENLANDIIGSDLPEREKTEILKSIANAKEQKLNIMITGATGCGKSSTINALFDYEVAKVGVGVDPETMDISKYELDNMVLWDSPGLGDGKEADNRHSKNIINKLLERDENGNALIDLVLVILDGSTKDLGTSYELINQVIIPNLGDDRQGRILVAINQCDVAMKGKYWDSLNNKPEPKLETFLNEKVDSVRKRIKEGTGVDIQPIYYSAGYKEADEKQNPYNLSKLLYFIIQHTPKEKRLVYVNNISTKQEMWKDNDDLKDYSTEIKKTFVESVKDTVIKGAEIGSEIGSILGSAGKVIGGVVGGVIGGAVGIVKSLFSKW
ncbi:GTPase [Veillonella caviae]|uniref:GTPase family protein n=1 Tax=Veillonella caviae TaxID=248316 RepID=UPI002A81C53F|nr:GTPase [Veillonella caviae]MDY4746814.1 GTPase [Veillonella caviae]MDY6225226.1 GTPase [Veillonella caviae]